MDLRDEVLAEKEELTKSLRAQLESLEKPYRAGLADLDATIMCCKVQLVLLREQDEAARAVAAAMQKDVPAPLQWPKGIVWKQRIDIELLDESKIPERFTMRIPDEAAILDSDEEIPGVQKKIVTTVQLRRTKVN